MLRPSVFYFFMARPVDVFKLDHALVISKDNH